jgi:protein-disulfide isomerase
MIFRVFIVLLVLAGLYSLFGIGYFSWTYHRLENPKGDFQVMENESANITMVEFLNYGCGYCKDLHPVINEALTIRKDVEYVARPILYGEEGTPTDRLSRYVLAAGLQDGFWEMHEAVLSYPDIDVPDSVIQETAELYGIDYDQLIKDANSERVEKLAQDNLDAMQQAGITSVPSFSIDKKIYIVADENLPALRNILNIIPAS